MGTIILLFALLMVLIPYIMIDQKIIKELRLTLENLKDIITELEDRIKKLEQQDFN